MQEERPKRSVAQRRTAATVVAVNPPTVKTLCCKCSIIRGFFVICCAYLHGPDVTEKYQITDPGREWPALCNTSQLRDCHLITGVAVGALEGVLTP